jgi:hypothetical protein
MNLILYGFLCGAILGFIGGVYAVAPKDQGRDARGRFVKK